MTNWIVSRTDEQGGCNRSFYIQLVDFWESGDIGPHFAKDQIGCHPWNDEEAILKKSPLRYKIR